MFKNRRNFIEYLVLSSIAVLIVAYVIVNYLSIQASIGRFFSVLTPFYIGFGIAYVLNRPISAFEKALGGKRGLIIAVTYLGLILGISMFSAYVVPQIIDNGISLGREISKGVIALMKQFQGLDFGPYQEVVYENLNRMAEIVTTVSNFIVSNLTQIFINITSTFMNVFFGIIISVYMLLDKHKVLQLFKNVTRSIFGKEKSERIIFHASEVNTVFSHFLTGLLVEAFIVGILAYLGLSVMGVRFALILGLIIMSTNVIPYIGPFIGAIPAVTVTLMYDPIKALWVVVFIVILQQFDGNFIGPRVMGNYIGLDPIWIILSITIGGGLWGVLGILLAIPTGAIIKITLSRMITKYDEKHHQVKK
ncbi:MULTISPECIES: AI-2E family transporter [unclassified Fusibacter]|uniref:AI-2E family transporter n=1 Tax=unclassified Fusibacter TaxID=2624464 RepID=UPI0010110212|nr:MULTISPECIES: AI-2E family transporter [unclassified Fusibacter]MCK8061187.1 AI-2E family transporter [Fusibacter sp. A2]NPE23276.1 AI-2E family transporter [Fusibacter sp. A1]RXV59319.1 AI-2E family transporter [Fusibacter sp. A1]